MNGEFLIQLVLNGLVVGTLYGVVAMSFVLIYKATQVVNFAQGEFLLIGAWCCWWLLTRYQLPFWLGMPITLVFIYTTIMNIFERPEGIKIATWFIATIILTSMISRVMRSTK